MPLKTSFFHKELFRKNLARFWPLWGMASFVGALFPLALIANLPSWQPQGGALGGRELLYGVLYAGVPILSLLYAVLCAAAVWSYLYNARSVGLLHTLPIRRESLFATNVLSGLTMMAIPYAVTGLLTVLAFSLADCLDGLGILVTVLGVVGESLFFFALATLCAFLTGNVFMLPALYVALNFLEPLLDFLVNQFAGGFIFGLRGNYSGALEWLSPVVYLIHTVRCHSEYEYLPDANGVTRSRLTAVTLENGQVIAFYALAGVVLLALAWLLYRARRSETAGDVMAFRPTWPLFRYGAATLAAMGGGLLLYALFFGERFGSEFRAVPLALCMTVAGLIGYYAAGMLLHKSLRVFKGSLRGAAIVLAFSAALCAALHFDVAGAARRAPEIGQVAELEFYAADNTYFFYPGEEDALLEEVRALHRQIVAEADYIRATEELGYYPAAAPSSGLSYAEQAQYTHTFVRFSYTLRSGRTVNRYYSLPLNSQRMAQGDTYDSMLDRLINSRAMMNKRLRVDDPRFSVEGGSLYLSVRGQGYDLSSREAKAILDAVGRDADLGRWGIYDWFGNNERDKYAMSLSLELRRDRGDGVRSYDYLNIYLRPGMEETLACLKELKLVEGSDLKTYREVRPWAYYSDAETEAFTDKYGMSPQEYYEQHHEMPPEGDWPVNALEYAHSADVIGGADGNTAIFVAG